MILKIMAARFLSDVTGPGGRDFSRGLTNERVPHGDTSPVEYSMEYDTESQLMTIRHMTRDLEPAHVAFGNIVWMREFPPPAPAKVVVAPVEVPAAYSEMPAQRKMDSQIAGQMGDASQARAASGKFQAKPGKIVVAMSDDD